MRAFILRVCRARSPSATFAPATFNALPPRSAKDQLRSRWFIECCANKIYLRELENTQTVYYASRGVCGLNSHHSLIFQFQFM
jgi:hypothetical protein